MIEFAVLVLGVVGLMELYFSGKAKTRSLMVASRVAVICVVLVVAIRQLEVVVGMPFFEHEIYSTECVPALVTIGVAVGLEVVVAFSLVKKWDQLKQAVAQSVVHPSANIAYTRREKKTRGKKK